MLTHARLRELIHYDPDTGVMTWRIARRAQAPPGDVAGGPTQKGYWHIRIDGTLYKRHRLAWLYMTETTPSEEVDHINRKAGDDRFTNLRLATPSDNKCNQGIPQ